MMHAHLWPLTDLARRWLPATALSVAAHAALAAGLFGLAGLARPPAPEPLAAAVMVVEVVPGAAFMSTPAAASAPAARPAATSAPAGAPAPYSGVTQHQPVGRPPPPLPAVKPPLPRRVVAVPPAAEKPAPPLPAQHMAEAPGPEPVRPPAAGAAADPPAAGLANAAAPQSAVLPAAPAYGIAAHGNRPPRYPDEARRRGIEGRVLLRVHVTSEGTANRVMVLESSGHAVLDRAARRAVARWRFTPATLAGVPVAGAVEVPVTFRLTD